MTYVAIGILIWSLLHFIPVLGQGLRTDLRERIGATPYQAIFSLGVLGAIVLMVFGWRTGQQFNVYEPAAWGRPVGTLFIFTAFLLFGLAHAKTNVKRFIRHPQLTGLVIWAMGHLMANGDNLSLILFGGLGLWAFVSIQLINRRDGIWHKPDRLPLSAELRPALIGVVIFAVFLMAHSFLFGVSPFPHG